MKKVTVERIFPMRGEWMNFKLTLVLPEDKAKKKKIIKTRDGNFCTINKYRTKFNLAFNGVRFSETSELLAFKKRLPPNVVRYNLSRCRAMYKKFMAIDPDA